MGVNIKKWSGVVVLAALMSTAGSVALAEEKEAELPALGQSSVPEAVDRNTKIDTFWDEAFIGGDAKFLFGIDYKDNQLDKDARRIQVMYQDMLDQQDRDNPTVRTRDMPNPYSTSLYELNGL